jgi:hypothetical protein
MLHPEINNLLMLFEQSYSLTVPKSIDPDNERLTILDEVKQDGRGDAKKVKARDDYGVPSKNRPDAYEMQVEIGRKVNERD